MSCCYDFNQNFNIRRSSRANDHLRWVHWMSIKHSIHNTYSYLNEGLYNATRFYVTQSSGSYQRATWQTHQIKGMRIVDTDWQILFTISIRSSKLLHIGIVKFVANISTRWLIMKWYVGQGGNEDKFSIWKLRVKRQHGRPSRGWKDI
jgi:hypothetical protein